MLELELSSEVSNTQCVPEAPARSGRIDVLIKNAGVLHPGMAEETTPKIASAVFETNFLVQYA